MNSYQKQKIQIQDLKRKLLIVCLEPNSIQAILIIAEQKLKREYEKQIWSGNAITKDKILEPII